MRVIKPQRSTKKNKEFSPEVSRLALLEKSEIGVGRRSVPPRGSGWVRSRAAADLHHPSIKAVAGGTDPIQAWCRLFKASFSTKGGAAVSSQDGTFQASRRTAVRS